PAKGWPGCALVSGGAGSMGNVPSGPAFTSRASASMAGDAKPKTRSNQRMPPATVFNSSADGCSMLHRVAGWHQREIIRSLDVDQLCDALGMLAGEFRQHITGHGVAREHDGA